VPNDGIGVVIVGHGSRRAEANMRHEQFVAKWRDQSCYDIVEAAHMEFAQPSIGTAFDSCVAAGATSVVIVPLFLWPGAHLEHDIPIIVAQAAARHPGVAYAVGPSLGAHPLLSQIVDDHLASVTDSIARSGHDVSISHDVQASNV
jgi:sirohydrochlorin ferrochelatase